MSEVPLYFEAAMLGLHYNSAIIDGLSLQILQLWRVLVFFFFSITLKPRVE